MYYIFPEFNLAGEQDDTLHYSRDTVQELCRQLPERQAPVSSTLRRHIFFYSKISYTFIVVKRYRLLEYLDRIQPAPGDRETALSDAHRIADYLKKTYGAEVYGIGSLFREDKQFTEKSDIDLVVKGLPLDSFFSILAVVDRMTKFPVDLTPYEAAKPFLRQIADEEGVLL